MALQKDIVDERFGGIFSGAYIKLAYLRWSDSDSKIVATVSVFASPEARAAGKECISNEEIDVTDLFPNIQQTLYDKIKLDPRFSGAINV